MRRLIAQPCQASAWISVPSAYSKPEQTQVLSKMRKFLGKIGDLQNVFQFLTESGIRVGGNFLAIASECSVCLVLGGLISGECMLQCSGSWMKPCCQREHVHVYG
eukprot:690209-Amphidinium_carterae.1